jgi:hypothetical protein
MSQAQMPAGVGRVKRPSRECDMRNQLDLNRSESDAQQSAV